MAERHVGELLERLFRRDGMVRAMRRAEAVVLWPRVVGPDVARFTRARSLKGGVLYVEVTDSETSMHLGLQRARFVEAYRERFGVREVREIRFRVGLRPDREAERRGPGGGDAGGDGDDAGEGRGAVDSEAWSRLSAGLGRLDLPEGVARPALAAGRAWAAFQRRKREEGWRPCPHCGALSPNDGPCDACARYRASERVGRAAHRLMVDPAAATPMLSEEERVVARALALERLDDELFELLPQVITDPRLRGQLEAGARCRLALERGVGPEALSDDDWARLDPRISRALGRHR